MVARDVDTHRDDFRLRVFHRQFQETRRRNRPVDATVRAGTPELGEKRRGEKSKSENRRQRKTGLSAERSERGVHRSDGKDERERGESGVERVFGV